MRYIALTEAKAGMQLATSLYDSNGRTLVGSHILLTDNYIEKLIEYGYAGIYIEDELTQDIEVEDAIRRNCVRRAWIASKKEILTAARSWQKSWSKRSFPREGFLWICWICVPMTIIPMHIP